jgi:calcium-dependent protein kinase
MGNKGSADRLKESRSKAIERVGTTAVSSRYNRLPKKLEDDYNATKEVLGTGYNSLVNGDVFKAQGKRDKLWYAVKPFHLSGVVGEKLAQLEAEATIFLSMDHPHIARLVDVYESETFLYLVMECMTGGELFDRLEKRKRFSERDASHALYQMLLAVNYLHGRDVVHRDLKLENFLYEKPEPCDHLKLIDFGFSHIWEKDTKMALSCGTLAYVAPEVLRKSYTSKCDLWSMGIILFILLAGYMPFSGDDKQQKNAIMAGKPNWREDRWKSVSADAMDLVKKLMQKDANLRLSACQALEHPFILRHDRLDVCSDAQEGAAQALLEFAQASKWRRACMSVMAWSLTNEERASVRDMFIQMDKNKKGTITMSELKDCLSKLKKTDKTDEDFRPIFEALDTAGNDEIHYSEFLAAMVSTRIAMHDNLLKTTFGRFDVDNSGFITIDNLRTVLGETFSGAEVEQLVAEADQDKNGKISYEEFIGFLKDGEADDFKVEAVGKIIDHEKAKPGSGTAENQIGSLGWLKESAGGLIHRTGLGSLVGSSSMATAPTLPASDSMQVVASETQTGRQSGSKEKANGGGSTAAQQAELSSEQQVLIAKNVAQASAKKSSCCNVM